MNFFFSPKEQFEFQAKNKLTKELMQQFASQEPLNNILLFVFNNFHILYTEEKNLTLWENIEFYKNYLKYRKNLQDAIEKELYFNFVDKKFSKKGFYINIITRINYFLNQENQKFFYIGNNFTCGLDLEKKMYYKFDFDLKINMIKIQPLIFYSKAILLPYHKPIDINEIENFQKWSKIKYNKNTFQIFKKKETSLYYIKILIYVITFLLLFLLFFFKGM